MLGSAEQDAFVSRSVVAIVTTIRADGSPASSMVAFARRDDRLFFTTNVQRAKARMLERDSRATVVVLNQHEPWSFVSIDGDVVIHRNNPPELRQLMLDAVDHPDYVWSRNFTETAIAADGRAMFELVPTRVSGVVALRGILATDE
jgi:PPOX class probable F420-dependent enzyme